LRNDATPLLSRMGAEWAESTDLLRAPSVPSLSPNLSHPGKGFLSFRLWIRRVLVRSQEGTNRPIS